MCYCSIPKSTVKLVLLYSVSISNHGLVFLQHFNTFDVWNFLQNTLCNGVFTIIIKQHKTRLLYGSLKFRVLCSITLTLMVASTQLMRGIRC